MQEEGRDRKRRQTVLWGGTAFKIYGSGIFLDFIFSQRFRKITF